MGELITKTNGNYTTTYTSTFKKEMAADFKYEGEKNKTCMKGFAKLCRKTQTEMKAYLKKRLQSGGYKNIYDEDGFLYAPGDLPVLVTAHMDTVHDRPVIDFYEYVDPVKGTHKIHSPQGIGGDDRCGIYIILRLIDAGYMPYVLFCENEEIGCIGSHKFTNTDHSIDLCDLKYLIQIDRRGNNDAVFYDCDNEEFTKYIEKVTGYKEAYGTCSDISYLAPASGTAAVNLSCGYYNEHHLNEYVILEEMMGTFLAVEKLILDLDNAPSFQYIEKKYYGYGKYAKYGYYGYYDDYDDYWGSPSTIPSTTTKANEKDTYYVFWEENGEYMNVELDASSEAEAAGMFLMNYDYLTYADIEICKA